MKLSFKLGSVLLLGVLLLSACTGQTVTKDDASPEVQSKVDTATETTKAEDASSNGQEDTKEVEEVEEPAEEEVTKAKVGETLNIDGVKVTVVSIEKFDGRINQFEPLQEDHAIKINVIAENTTKESVFIDAVEFKLFDIEGFELERTIPGDEESLSAELPAGKKAKGALFFDVPKQEGVWELHYEGLFSFEGDSAIWELDAK